MRSKRLTWSQNVTRWTEILQLNRAGLTHQAIADKLGIGRITVTYYLSPRCKAPSRTEHAKGQPARRSIASPTAGLV